jgi:hypothetical protein
MLTARDLGTLLIGIAGVVSWRDRRNRPLQTSAHVHWLAPAGLEAAAAKVTAFDSFGRTVPQDEECDPMIEIRKHPYGLDIIAQQQSERLYYLSDGLGSVRQLVDTTGEVQTNYAYDPFGVPVVATDVSNPQVCFLGNCRAGARPVG